MMDMIGDSGHEIQSATEEIRQLRADLARVTAERDELHARNAELKREADRVRHEKWVESDLACYHRLDEDERIESERDALRALLPTKAEREALVALRRDGVWGSPTGRVETALAYLDRLLNS